MELQKIKIEYYNSASEFVNKFITGDKSDLLQRFIFRGVSSAKYELLPTALRLNNQPLLWQQAEGKELDKVPNPEWDIHQIMAEYRLLSKFFIIADRNGLQIPSVDRIRKKIHHPFEDSYKNEKWIPSDLKELAGLAQHYGIFTRLLDWSIDFFVSLYFAASNAAKDYQEGSEDFMVIWALNSWLLDGIISLEKLPLHIIRPPYYSNPNLAAQAGVFTLWEIDWQSELLLKFKGEDPKIVDRTPLDKLLINHTYMDGWNHNQQPILYKFLLPVTECFKLMEILYKLNYDAARLFPGYAGVAKSIQDQSLYFENL